MALRLVTTGPAEAAGVVQGALEIALEPGWKTYWRDPGDTGIPPSIDPSGSENVASASFSFPAPERVDEGFGSWAGYTVPVTLPVTFVIDGPVKMLEANVFLGVCKEICIPVQATLALDPRRDIDSAGDRTIVRSAFAALPKAPSARFGIRAAEIADEILRIEARVPPGGDATQLFIASGNGYLLGAPERKEIADDIVSFSARVLKAPADPAASLPLLDYTLVAGGRSVSGKLPANGHEADR